MIEDFIGRLSIENNQMVKIIGIGIRGVCENLESGEK